MKLLISFSLIYKIEINNGICYIVERFKLGIVRYLYLFLLLLLFFFEIGPCSVAQDSPEFEIFLPQPL